MRQLPLNSNFFSTLLITFLVTSLVTLVYPLSVFPQEKATIKYTIRPKDTLMTISFKYYNTHQCWKLIELANSKISNSNDITPGTSIVIPPAERCPISKKKSVTRKNIVRPKKIRSININDKSDNYLAEVDASDFIVFNNSSGQQQTLSPNVESKPKEFKKRETYRDPFHRQKVAQEKQNRFYKRLQEKIADQQKREKQQKKESTANISKILQEGQLNTSLKKYTIQLAAFNTKKDALNMKEQLKTIGFKPHIEKANLKNGQTWFRVRLGFFEKRGDAKKFASKKRINLFVKNYYIVKI